MFAAVMHTYGDPSVLVGEEVVTPQAPPGWVRVNLRCSALNWHDVLVRQGLYGSPLPHILGADGAGVRADTGEDVLVIPSLHWGERSEAPGPQWEILGDHTRGTLAESVVVPIDCIAPKPPSWSWAEAAAIPLVGLTVVRALINRARLRSGERVLVLGAGGGVASMAVMVARAVGAEVYVTAGSEDKLAHAVSLGAAGGVLYRDQEWPRHAADLVPDRFDVVLDSVGTWTDSLQVLRPGGRLVTIGASLRNEQVIEARPFYFGQYDLLGSTMGGPADLAVLLDLIHSGRLEPPPVGTTFPLTEAAEAHRQLEAGTVLGKIVVETS